VTSITVDIYINYIISIYVYQQLYKLHWDWQLSKCIIWRLFAFTENTEHVVEDVISWCVLQLYIYR